MYKYVALLILTFSFPACETNILEPSNTQSIFTLHLVTMSNVKMEIYNTYDVCVRTLIDEQMDPGDYYVYWDHKGDNKQIVSEGIYFFKLFINGNLVDHMDLYLFNDTK